jgi:hypothetical protein
VRATIAILITALFSVSTLSAQTEPAPVIAEADEEPIRTYALKKVYVFKNPRDRIRFDRLMYNVKKVYPIALEAERMLEEIERNVGNYKTPAGQKAYIKKMEKQLTEQYTPVLKTMTFTQGMILIKLIDRQTTRTGYSIVKDLRGGFRAGMYQGVARIFGANLKDRYDREGDDRMIEEIIEMIEMGLI